MCLGELPGAAPSNPPAPAPTNPSTPSPTVPTNPTTPPPPTPSPRPGGSGTGGGSIEFVRGPGSGIPGEDDLGSTPGILGVPGSGGIPGGDEGVGLQGEDEEEFNIPGGGGPFIPEVPTVSPARVISRAVQGEREINRRGRNALFIKDPINKFPVSDRSKKKSFVPFNRVVNTRNTPSTGFFPTIPLR